MSRAHAGYTPTPNLPQAQPGCGPIERTAWILACVGAVLLWVTQPLGAAPQYGGQYGDQPPVQTVNYAEVTAITTMQAAVPTAMIVTLPPPPPQAAADPSSLTTLPPPPPPPPLTWNTGANVQPVLWSTGANRLLLLPPPPQPPPPPPPTPSPPSLSFYDLAGSDFASITRLEAPAAAAAADAAQPAMAVAAVASMAPSAATGTAQTTGGRAGGLSWAETAGAAWQTSMLAQLPPGPPAYSADPMFVSVARQRATGRKQTSFERQGKPWFFHGANMWGAAILASTAAGRKRLGRELDRMHNAGLRGLRVMALSEGPRVERWRVSPTAQDGAAPGVFNADVEAGLDHLLVELGKRGMVALLVLGNFCA